MRLSVALVICAIVVSPTFGLQNGKSSGKTEILYETKEFRSATQNSLKAVDRFTVQNTFSLQLNRKNKLTTMIPWSLANLSTKSDGRTVKDSVEGFKDIKIIHEMTTQKVKGDRLGVQWKFRMDLPNGKEQLNASENRVTSAMGETGQGFSDPTFGKGLNLGVDLNLTDQINQSITNIYTLGYTLNGSYSSLLESRSYKKPGDNLIFNCLRSSKLGKNKKFSYGLGANFTRRTFNYRPNDIVSENPSRLEGNLQFKYENQRNAKLQETFAVKFQERGEIEVQESNGQIVRTEQGDRWTLNWVFNNKRHKNLTENYGLLGIFGAANNNLEVVAPVTGNATAIVGKDRNTRMEEVQLLYGRKYQINRHRQMFYNATLGLTDDSRDYTLGGGYVWKF